MKIVIISDIHGNDIPMFRTLSKNRLIQQVHTPGFRGGGNGYVRQMKIWIAGTSAGHIHYAVVLNRAILR